MHAPPLPLPSRHPPLQPHLSTSTITIRDFLTARHGFTLPTSHTHVSSFAAAAAHTCSSLFRNGRAFGVHFHAGVEEGDCRCVLRGEEEWGGVFDGGGGGRGGGGNITLWAHFVRRWGVSVLGQEEVKREKKGCGKGWCGGGAYALPPPSPPSLEGKGRGWVYFSPWVEILPVPVGEGEGEVSPSPLQIQLQLRRETHRLTHPQTKPH